MDGRATVSCKWCRTPTEMLGTRECDRCHELYLRISRDQEQAIEMLRQLKQAEAWAETSKTGKAPFGY